MGSQTNTYLLQLIGFCLISSVPAYYLQACGKPSDVVFLLDSSGSIYKHEFQKQLAFVNNVIDEFDVAPDKMRVGGISFSNWAFLEFYLNTHVTKRHIKAAISRVVHSRGDTNTAAALTFLKDNMFQFQHGGRPGVPRVAIVLTDGESNDPMQTAYQAEAARRMGIQIFAIGIGHKVNIAELKNIASYPPERYLFQVANYEALKSIRDTVAIRACEETTPLPVLTTPAPKPVHSCLEAVKADVMLAVSPRGSDDDTKKALDFFQQLSRGLDVAADRVHVGLVPKDCRDVPQINTNTFMQKAETLRTLDMMTSRPQADVTDVLRYMRKKGFSNAHGSRHHAKKVAVMIVDENPDNLSQAKKEAQRLRHKNDVELYVIGVGNKVKPSKLRKLAGGPADEHVIHIDSYDDLYRLIPMIQLVVCPAPIV